MLRSFSPLIPTPSQASLLQQIPSLPKDMKVDQAELDGLSQRDKPPGLAIRALALVDGIALFTVLLIGAALVVPGKIQGQVQGLATLIFSLAILIVGAVTILAALALVLLMVSLLLAIPFGTSSTSLSTARSIAAARRWRSG